MFKIIVLGKVQPQLRPIISTQTEEDEDGNKKKVQVIDPPKCRKYKAKVSETTRNMLPDNHKLLDEPIKVELQVFMPITKSWTKERKRKAENNEIFPTHKSDVDNLAKGVVDGMTGVVWKDDGCIVDLSVSKRYSKYPRAEVRIYQLNNTLEWE